MTLRKSHLLLAVIAILEREVLSTAFLWLCPGFVSSFHCNTWQLLCIIIGSLRNILDEAAVQANPALLRVHVSRREMDHRACSL